MRRLVLTVFLLAISLQLSTGQSILPAAKAASAADQTGAYVPMRSFDEHRNAVADIQAAIAEAQRTHKRIILDIGGDWCPYCAQLSQLFRANPALRQLRDASFITVYIYYGQENHNQKALARYGKFVGIPHYFVLHSDGSLLHSEHLLDLRANGFYSPEKVKQFLTQWAPPSNSAVPAANGN